MIVACRFHTCIYTRERFDRDQQVGHACPYSTMWDRWKHIRNKNWFWLVVFDESVVLEMEKSVTNENLHISLLKWPIAIHVFPYIIIIPEKATWLWLVILGKMQYIAYYAYFVVTLEDMTITVLYHILLWLIFLKRKSALASIICTVYILSLDSSHTWTHCTTSVNPSYYMSISWISVVPISAKDNKPHVLQAWHLS